ncbi:hypothetical protein [Agarilytica rhodophyticola]|uniref:hypothetical protein n=1 Tax=Agarilytica rhodophyticola TaxID=1737490 RepID=UPI001319E713|nr:hypothetical protein [Agarilytica rhodophyticola]
MKEEQDLSNTTNVYDLCERLAKNKMLEELQALISKLSAEKQKELLIFVQRLTQS